MGLLTLVSDHMYQTEKCVCVCACSFSIKSSETGKIISHFVITYLPRSYVSPKIATASQKSKTFGIPLQIQKAKMLDEDLKLLSLFVTISVS